MGSGSRFIFNKTEGFGIGFYVSTFPFKLTINISFLFWYISLGFGKAYDE